MSTTHVARSIDLRTPTALDEVDRVVADSAASFDAWSATEPHPRAGALRTVADHLDSGGDELIEIAMRETHLPAARLRGELARTTFQLRLFADVVDRGAYLDARIDHADPEWPMGVPRPDLRRMLFPLGPVVVFSASNFPFAFSVAGGDTAAALAAGCPVIVKAHSGHLDLSAATAAVVIDALEAAGAPRGVLTIISGVEAGKAALAHPLVKAGAFTGSIHAGRTLFDIAQSRPEPIPFYGELGSVNPTFITASAVTERLDALREGLIASFSGSAGQLCTKPGAVFVPRDSPLLSSLRATALPGPAPLLNPRVETGYATSVQVLHDDPDVQVVTVGDAAEGDGPAPVIFSTTAARILADGAHLLDECFGPATLLIEYAGEAEMLAVARSLQGQLTATIHATSGDDVSDLLSVLSRKAGRVLWNDWPTGVSVTYAQQHGGPYPSSTTPTTSVGTAAIERFLRPVAFQNVPDRLLPAPLRDTNPLAIPRHIDGYPEETK